MTVSKRRETGPLARLARGLAMLALAGCVAPQATGRASLFDGALTLAAPPGYCLEPGTTQQRAEGAILLFGRCAGQSQRAPAVLTAAVGAPGSGTGLAPATDGAALAAFFRSDAGRRALSRRGRAADVQVLEARGRADAFLIRLRDSGAARAAAAGAVQAESWRAVLPLRGRLVTLTAAGPADAALDRDAGLALLSAFVTATVAANRP